MKADVQYFKREKENVRPFDFRACLVGMLSSDSKMGARVVELSLCKAKEKLRHFIFARR